MLELQTLQNQSSETPIPRSQMNLYDRDFVEWVTVTIGQLDRQDYSQVDWENLLEEIGDMSRRERQSLESNLVILLLHLLKWQYQTDRRSGSWKGSIVEHRRRILKTIQRSPSLMAYLQDCFAEAYDDAIEQAAAETGLDPDCFPVICEYTIDQCLDTTFFPE
jgi:Domain of unknown function DUF29